MRDIIITLVVFGSLPFIMTKPYLGVLELAWLGYMNPHRLAYGFAHDFPFTLVVVAVTIIAIIAKEKNKSIPWNGLIATWVIFMLWMTVTTIFAIDHDESIGEWVRTVKIQLIVFLTLLVIKDEYKLNLMVWVIALSIGFYGIKGGLFSVLTLGKYRVWGPEGTFIGGNNEIALALIMVIPLMRYLQVMAENQKVRWMLIVFMVLTMFAIITSHSRGALLATAAMAMVMWWRSQKKAMFGVVMAITAAMILLMMPQEWYDRMQTLQSYEEEGSAVGRLIAWEYAYHAASQRFLGGGYGSFVEDNYKRFAPHLSEIIIEKADGRYQDAHSIYFEVLGEHGFVGLILFLMIGAGILVLGQRIIRQTKNIESMKWAKELAGMLQVSLIGYSVGGAFLGLAYFDLPYHIMALMVILSVIVEKQLSEEKNNSSEDANKEIGTMKTGSVAAPKNIYE